MEYEQEFENALMQLCEVCVTFYLKFRVFGAYDIHFDIDKHEIIAPLLESERILDYFKRYGFSVKNCIKGMLYEVSIAS